MGSHGMEILPLILGYTAYSYYVFWDATGHDAYH